MSRVGIVTDSTNCLSPEIIKEYDIRVVPMVVVIEGKSYRDLVDITPAEFYPLFKGLKEMPTTSAASPGDFTNAFAELARVTDSIVCIVVSKILSATFGAAEQARETVQSENHGLKIEIVDSKNSQGALGFIALEAARAAQAGKSLAEVVAVAQDMVPRVKYVAVLDTLKYLMKLGRAPKTAIIGEVLQVKPFIGMVGGTGLVESLGKTRGKQKAMVKMVDMVKDYVDSDKPLHVIVHYSDRIEEGEELKKLVTSKYNCTEVYMTEYTPVMASATGPMVGVAFYA
ncbi:DegV family protein [Chloroflexota bacterium]